MLKQNRPKPPKTTKKSACRQIEVRLQSDSDKDDVMADLLMVDSGDDERDATSLAPNDYIMVTYASKKAIHDYVGMTVEPTGEFADEFEILFLKCTKKSATATATATATANRFTILDEDDIVDVPFDDRLMPFDLCALACSDCVGW